MIEPQRSWSDQGTGALCTRARRICGTPAEFRAATRKRRRFLSREQRAPDVDVEGVIEIRLGDGAERHIEVFDACVCIENIDTRLFSPDGVIKPVKIDEISGVTLHASNAYRFPPQRGPTVASCAE